MIKPMGQIFNIGQKISGFCDGYFGRDDYKDKLCVMISQKYAVFEYADRTAVVLNYFEGLEDLADKWSEEDE